MKKNEELRTSIKDADLKMWQVADKLNLNDGNFSRKLRKEFSETEKKKVYEVIQTLLKEREDHEK